MRRILVLVFLVAGFASCGTAELRYSVTGEYKGLTAQGMAIWEDNAYLFNNTGLCRVYDLTTSSVTREFRLGCAGPATHVNSVCFGKEFPEGGAMPALYVGEWTGEGRLFVENVLPDRSEWIQTIRSVKDGEALRMLTWAVDAENGFLYGVSRDETRIEELGYAENTFYKYRLPRLDEGSEVVLSEEDVLESFVALFPNVLQGSKIRNGNMYVVTGYQETISYMKKAPRAVKVIDLGRGEVVRTVDLTLVTTNEPEDMDFHRGKPLLWVGQSGGLYKFKLK